MYTVMGIPGNINIVTALIGCIFLLPVIAGVLRPPDGNRIRRSFASLFGNLLLLASIILSVYLTRLLLSDTENPVLTFLYRIVPALRVAVANHDPWVTITFIAAILLTADGILYGLTLPIYKHMVEPIGDGFSAAVQKMGGFARSVVGGLWQLPRSMWLVLVFSLLLNFYTGFYRDSAAGEYANTSAPYQLIQANVIQPLLNNSVVKNVQVLLNDSFKRPANGNNGEAAKSRLIIYFNGVTLDSAVKSDAAIDAKAKKIAGSETNGRRKAFLLYEWVCKNISYDNGKAAIIAKNPSKAASGAIVAYDTKSGVCFDYSCLYVAMCRAAGLKVRFVTGLGYTGTAWGDHAWNQVYDSKSNAWIDVDTTFGSSGVNYFDRPNFGLDHADGVIQGEW